MICTFIQNRHGLWRGAWIDHIELHSCDARFESQATAPFLQNRVFDAVRRSAFRRRRTGAKAPVVRKVEDEPAKARPRDRVRVEFRLPREVAEAAYRCADLIQLTVWCSRNGGPVFKANAGAAGPRK